MQNSEVESVFASKRTGLLPSITYHKKDALQQVMMSKEELREYASLFVEDDSDSTIK